MVKLEEVAIVDSKIRRLSEEEVKFIEAHIMDFNKKLTRKQIKEIHSLFINRRYSHRDIREFSKIVRAIRVRRLNKLKQKESFKKWAHRNPVRYRARTLIAAAKYRSKQRVERTGEEEPFNLDVKWVEERLIQGVCEATGLPLVIKKYSTEEEVKKEPIHPRAPSIDRIDSDLYYTKDNCRIVCDQINKALSDKSDEQSYRLFKAFVQCYELKHNINAELVNRER